MGVKIQDDSVSQHRGRQFAQIVDAEMKPASQQRQYAPAFNQCLRAAGRTAIANVTLREVVGFLLIRLSSHDEFYRIVLNVRGNQHLMAYRTKLQNIVAIKHSVY